MTETRQAPKTSRRPRPSADGANKRKTASEGSKLDLIVARLSRPEGASLAELVAVTGWQPHSVRGALAGALKKKGHAVVSEKVDGERRYRIGATP